MSTLLAPLLNQRFYDANNVPLVGGKVFTYIDGTSTKTATFTDGTGSTQNTNPIILDARGECAMWLSPGQSYKILICPATDTDPPTSPIRTINSVVTPASTVQLTQPTTDLMTGDGTTTVYSLSANPANVNNVLFSLGGAIQIPGVDYTLSGVTVTCASPPPAGVAGFFNYMVALPVGIVDSGQVTFNNSASYVDGSVGSQLKHEIWALLKPTNTAAQNDAAVLTAAGLAQAAGGGTVRLPPGNFNHSHIAWNMASFPNVNIRGSGKSSTILTKSDATTTPVLDIAATSLLQAGTNYSDFSIVGSSSAPALRTTLIAIFSVRNLNLSGALIGWDNVGSLIASSYDVDLRSNATGYRATRSGSVYPNLVSFFGGQVIGNTGIGFDIVHGNGVTWDHVDIEMNGVFGNTATGGVFIRSTTNLEIAYGTFTFAHNCWFESNHGYPITVENAAGIQITVSDTKFIRNSATNDSAVAMQVGAVESIKLSNVFAVSSLTGNLTVNLAASRSLVESSLIGILNDASTTYTHTEIGTSIALVQGQYGDSSGNITTIGSAAANFASAIVVGGTNVSKKLPLNGAATTIGLPLPTATTNPSGAEVLITGADASGVAFARKYLLAISVSGGAGAAVAATLIGTSGSTTPTFTFNSFSGFANVTVASGNVAQVVVIGG